MQPCVLRALVRGSSTIPPHRPINQNRNARDTGIEGEQCPVAGGLNNGAANHVADQRGQSRTHDQVHRHARSAPFGGKNAGDKIHCRRVEYPEAQ